MGLRTALVRLDEAVLPRLARGGTRVGAWLRGRRTLLLAGVFVVAAAVAAASLLGSHAPPPAANRGSRVGINEGDSIPDYFARSRQDLAQLAATAPDRPVYALVSFTAYLDPDQVAAAVAGAPGLETVAALARVPLPHRQTEIVRLPAARIPGDLRSAMIQVANRKRHEAAEYAARASASPALSPAHPSAGSSGGSSAATSAEIATAESDAYRAGCACVYALVVRGVPGELTRLSNRVGVRGVQAAPDLDDAVGTVFVAPLPEQLDRATPPVDGP